MTTLFGVYEFWWFMAGAASLLLLVATGAVFLWAWEKFTAWHERKQDDPSVSTMGTKGWGLRG